MNKVNRSTIAVQGTEIAIISSSGNDFISLTDMLRAKDGEFAIIKSQVGLNSYKISVKEWVEKTNAIGLRASVGRYGGTYAHKDIAFEFGMWISPKFKIYLIKEFQSLKEDENRRLSLSWNLNRTLSKLNYHIHTDAIRELLIPALISPERAAITYASEADLLNVALFGLTAKEWREKNLDKDGNIRDYASIEQLLVLANIEGMNAELIRMGLPQNERITRLNEIAIRQLKVLIAAPALKRLKE